jgi:hypothetical protein
LHWNILVVEKTTYLHDKYYMSVGIVDGNFERKVYTFISRQLASVAQLLKANFHSKKISTDRKFSENIIVKSWKFSTSKFFSDGKFVSAKTAGKFVVAVQRNCWRTRYFTKIRKFEKITRVESQLMSLHF